MDDLYLKHYGVKGMKWGIRRYQNSDGTYTGDGKIRSSVNRKSKEIKSKLSFGLSDIVDNPADIDSIRVRGGLSRKEAISCLKLANDLYNRARMYEPQITRDVQQSIKRSNSDMYGLNNRLKQRESLAAKIGSDGKKDNISFKKAANNINDVVRYTSITDPTNFTKSYKSIKDRLEAKGYSELKCKNYFSLFREGRVSHKAVQSIFESPDGIRFEIQFQTPQSQAVKELKLPLYNEVRNAGVTPKRKAYLINRMNQLGRSIDDPYGVFDI